MRSVLACAAIVVCALGLAANPAGAAGMDSTPAAKQSPDYVDAKAHIAAGNYAAAIPLLQKVVAADPKNADAFNYLGYSQRKSGDAASAFENYQKALALEPEHRGANEYLGELYLEMGEMDKAKERLEVLDGACFFGCEEYTDLKEAINAYIAKTGG